MDLLSKIILKTIHYADLFDYPLKLNEIHRFLISPRAESFSAVGAELLSLVEKEKVGQEGEFYFLPRRRELVVLRPFREGLTQVKMAEVNGAIHWLSLFPWVRLVSLTGALAVGNADEKADVDLMVVTSRGRLWLTRIALFAFLSLVGLKRKDNPEGPLGKICINLWCDEENMSVNKEDQDLVVAHEIAQMKPLVDKGQTYERFVEANLWLKKFLPNWKI